nr:uncharacterized protein LOC111510780 [Leptinotarsa decemlineata]
MASFTAQAALRAKWSSLVEEHSIEVPPEVTSKVTSVVGWLKQVDEGECSELGLAVQNHFSAINIRLGKTKKHSKHRQSLVTLSRRHSLVKMLDSSDLDGPPPLRRASTIDTTSNQLTHHTSKLTRRASLDDLEQESCQLTPKIDHRIIVITNEEKRHELLLQRQRIEQDSIIEEVDECSPQN